MYLLLWLAPTEEIERLHAQWVGLAIITFAFAMLLGLGNLLAVHSGRIAQKKRGSFYSLVSILTAAAVIVISFFDVWQGLEQGTWSAVAQGVSGPTMTLVYRYGIYPLQSSFMALLACLLAFAAFRTLRLRKGWGALLFLAGALIVLIALVLPELGFVRDWFVNVWATAGLRGVLLGIALGTLATMVRVLIGFDRPASE